MSLNDIKFGRLEPKDFKHVEKYPLEKLQLGVAPAHVEIIKPYPKTLVEWYNQGDTGCCVGYSFSWDATIRNSLSMRIPLKYNAKKLYVESRIVGGFGDPTNLYEGSTLDVACQVLAKKGHWRVFNESFELNAGSPFVSDGIIKYYWTKDINGIRAALGSGLTTVLGINWANTMMSPYQKENGDWWIDLGENYQVMGGHAIACVGISDERSAIALLNSWGRNWANGEICWLKYNDFYRIMGERGEVCVITDKPGPLYEGRRPPQHEKL